MVSKNSSWVNIWYIVFTLVGFGLRTQRLDFQPLWGDEGWSFYFAGQPVAELLALTAVDIHPPLYYLLLKGWLSLAGIGPEAARFLSVVWGTLLIPVAGVLGHRLVDRRVGVASGVASAAVVSLMPLAIYYAQEVRMYGLVTLLGALATYCLLRAESERGWWIAYILTATAALYTMYYAGFLIAAHGLVLFIRWLNQSPRRNFRALMTPFFVVGLLYLPWLIYTGRALTAYVENKRAVEGYSSLNFIRFFGDHMVAFSLGHLPPEFQQYAWAALPCVVMALFGGYVLARRDVILAYLFGPLLLGYGVNLLFPFTPPTYERTLLIAAPAFWILIATGIIRLWDKRFWLVGTVVIAMLTVNLASLAHFYNRPRHAAEDYRALLTDVAARATPQDTLLASYQWQWGFYHAYLPAPRPQIVTVPGWGEGWSDNNVARETQLTELLVRSPRLWFPAHQALGHMWEDQTEASLAELGFPARLTWYGPQTKLTLAAAPPESLQEVTPATFENLLRLVEARIGLAPVESGRGVVPIELVWEKLAPLGRAHRVSLRLVDESGRTWATRDTAPRAGQVFFTTMDTGSTITDRHGLLIEAGTPPGDYRVLLSVRREEDAHPLDIVDENNQPLGAEWPLGAVTVTTARPPIGAAALPIQTPLTEATFGTVRLLGYSLANGPFTVGDGMPLTLFWQALDSPAEATVLVQLQDAAGHIVTTYEQPPLWSPSAWTAGDLLRDPHTIPLAVTLEPGSYRVLAGLSGHAPEFLKSVTIADRYREFTAPEMMYHTEADFGEPTSQIALVGFDAPETRLAPGESLPVTLYWQGLEPIPHNWKVFVHLRNANNQIIAQQDQFPGAGQFPTQGWRPGEYITDSYQLTLPADTPLGEYRLVVGLYDPNDFRRLPIREENSIRGDEITLEAAPIEVIAGE